MGLEVSTKNGARGLQENGARGLQKNGARVTPYTTHGPEIRKCHRMGHVFCCCFFCLFVFIHFCILTHIDLNPVVCPFYRRMKLCLLKIRLCVLVEIILGQSNRFSEIFMFENRGLTHRRTPARKLQILSASIYFNIGYL